MVLDHFSKEIDTFEKFEQVIWNCTKNYLGNFILVAIKEECPRQYIDFALDIFKVRFLGGEYNGK